MFCVCDGHGINGHIVSAFIRSHLVSTLFIKTCKRNSHKAVEEENLIA
jgi:serine/threonine protein phosphatase PrpC